MLGAAISFSLENYRQSSSSQHLWGKMTVPGMGLFQLNQSICLNYFNNMEGKRENRTKIPSNPLMLLFSHKQSVYGTHCTVKHLFIAGLKYFYTALTVKKVPFQEIYKPQTNLNIPKCSEAPINQKEILLIQHLSRSKNHPRNNEMHL